VTLSQDKAAQQARSEAAQHAITARWAKTTDPAERRRQTQAGLRAAAVNRVVESWPELTEAQQQRLRALLRPVPERGDAA
jgi:hypothetical protein